MSVLQLTLAFCKYWRGLPICVGHLLVVHVSELRLNITSLLLCQWLPEVILCRPVIALLDLDILNFHDSRVYTGKLRECGDERIL